MNGYSVLRMAVLCCILAVPAVSQAAPALKSSPVNREELIPLLRQVLREDPNLVLDVLREHSETVLDVAQQGSNQRRLKALNVQWKQDMESPKQVALDNRPVRGALNAPVTVVAFSDFTCPYCMQAAGTLETLMREHEGKIRLIFKHFPLEGHKFSRLAAEYHVAATLQSPEKAWAMYDVLFRNGADLAQEGEPLLKRSAEEAGLDMKQLTADLRANAGKIKTIIEEDIEDGKRLGIQGTPNFLVNDIVVRGALPADLFGKAVLMAHEQAVAAKK